MRRISLFLVFTFCIVENTRSQSVSVTPKVQPAQGGHARSGNIALTWTLGEPFHTVIKNGNIMLTQGFQQPFYLYDTLIYSPVQTLEFSDYANNFAPLSVSNVLRFQVMNYDYLAEDSIILKYHVVDTSGTEVISVNNVKFLNDGSYYINNLSGLTAGLSYQLEFILNDENKYSYYIKRN